MHGDGMGVSGRAAGFLMGLGAAGKFSHSSFPRAELQWWVRVEGNPQLIKEQWRGVERGG